MTFTLDGSGLVSTWNEGIVRLWPLTFRENERTRILMEDKTALLGFHLDVDPTGKRLLVGSRFGPRVFLVPLDGGSLRKMAGLKGWVNHLAFSLDGRLAAAGSLRPSRTRVWDLPSATSEQILACTGGQQRRMYLAADERHARFLLLE